MTVTRRERERPEGEPTPLERHLLEHYQPVLEVAEQLSQRLTHDLTRDEYEEMLDAALSPAVSYHDLETICGVLTSADTVARHPLTPELKQLIIVTLIQQIDPRPVTMDDLLHPTDHSPGQALATAVGLTEQHPTDPKARRLLAFTALALQHGERVPGISEGWNNLLVPGKVIYDHVQMQDWPDAATAETSPKLHIRGLANSGYVSVASPIRLGYRQDQFFFSVNRFAGRQFRQTPQYRQWIERHRPKETAMQQVAQQAYVLARPCPPEYVSQPTIRIISQSQLEGLLHQTPSCNLLAMVKLGYALPAGTFNDPREKDRFRRPGQIGKLWRHYFVGETIDALAAWKQSPDYAAWKNNDRLEQLLLHEWQERLAPHCTVTATFVPPAFQPAFLIPERIIRQTLQKMFMPEHLSRLGYLLMADRDQNYLYWPNPQHGRDYRSHAHFQAMTNVRRRTENARSVLAQQVERCFSTVVWPPLPDHFPPQPPGQNVPVATYNQLTTMIAQTPGLTMNRLKRGGFLLDAQASHTRAGIGYCIVCPEGKAQREQIAASTWYAEVRQAQRQHGYANVGKRR